MGYSSGKFYSIYISEVVLEELARGDQEIATKRLDLISELPLLALNEAVEELAQQFLTKSNLPPKASDDALHIALATVYKVDYLLTWNCKHIANAQIQKKLSQISIESGYELPTICTPYELMGD